ncbi:MAG: hypothetical protein ACP5P0_01370, partial [Hydrogenobacter sp.]
KVEVEGKEYKPIAVLKLTSDLILSKEKLKPSQSRIIDLLMQEARQNNFILRINDTNLTNFAC